MAFDPQTIYYGVDGERYGPVTLPELRALLREGRIRPDDYVWDDDRDDWVAVRRYPILFESTDVPVEPASSGVRYEFEPLDESHPAVWRVRPDLPYAGFGIRLLAWILDDLVLLGPVFLWLVTLEHQSGLEVVEAWMASLRGEQLDPEQLDLLRQFNAGVFAMRGLYWSAMESSRWQGTVGKRLMGLVVTDERGYRLTFFRALGRYFGRILCELTFFLGYLLIFFSVKHQGLHDRIARTVVVRGR
jgi:uncharacterized RDD family membrane protein YckC